MLEPDDLRRRNAVDGLGEVAHELDAAAGDDISGEAVVAQIGQQLEHGLVDEVGVAALEALVLGGGEPSPTIFWNSAGDMPAWVAMTSSSDSLLAGCGHRLHVAFEHGLEGLLVLPFGVLGRHALHAVERESELHIHRLLDPQRAVIVEGGDAVLRRDVVAAFRVRHLRRRNQR